jgi:hypothetical protein
MATVILLLKALGEVLKDEFSEFGHSVQEQKFLEENTQTPGQIAEQKGELATAQTEPPTPAAEQQATSPEKRITPKRSSGVTRVPI